MVAPATGVPNWRTSPPLKIGTWNLGTHGLHHVEKVSTSLETINLDISALVMTESHISSSQTSAQAEVEHHLREWSCFWSGTSTHSAGTDRAPRGLCIAIRNSANMAPRQIGIPPLLDGTVCAVGLSTTRGRILLVGVYVPDSSASAASRVTTDLPSQAEVLTAMGHLVVKERPRWDHVVICGDFNFAHHPLDRPQSGLMGGQLNQCDHAAIAIWQATGLAEEVVDPHRRRAPNSTEVTFVHPRHKTAHRLDRFYVTPSLCEGSKVVHTTMMAEPNSGHMLVCLELPMPPRPPKGPRGQVRFKKADLSVRSHDAFKDWLETAAAKAPRGAPDLLRWWPTFKEELVRKTIDLGRQVRLERCTSLRRLEADAKVALEALVAEGPQPRPETYRRWQQAQDAALKALTKLGPVVAQEARRDRLPIYEQPSPAVTAMLAPRRAAPQIDKLRVEGTVVSAAHKMAPALGEYTASIYRAQPLSVEALSDMVEAVAARAPPPVAFRGLNRRRVDPDEVDFVLRRAKTKKATGLDGIASELYMAQPGVFAPLLARLFTAINQTDQAPEGFTDGLVVYLPKKTPGDGEIMSPADFRPITLLGADYKLYSSILSFRLVPMLRRAIPSAQTAFVQGRKITSNVWLSRAVHDFLLIQEKPGLAVDLDISKAYDQVSRTSLRRLWTALGGSSSLFWLTILCDNTRSRAFANGFVSPFFQLESGVRQGCPASPGLYLIVALGLYRLLERRGLGIHTYNVGRDLHRTVAAQYADDTTVYLNRHDLPKLRAAMEEYRLATGQRVNWDKSKIAPIGMWPTGLLPEGPACTVCVRGASVEQPAIPTISLADWAPLNIPVIAANTVDRARKGPGLVHRVELWDRLAQGPSRILDNIAKASQLTMFWTSSLYRGIRLPEVPVPWPNAPSGPGHPGAMGTAGDQRDQRLKTSPARTEDHFCGVRA